MEIGWTDVGSEGDILVSCAHSNTSWIWKYGIWYMYMYVKCIPVIEEDLALNKRPKAVMQIVEEQQELDQEVEEEDQLNVSKRILFESSSEKEKDAEEKV